ncbi:hypothetical protein [Pseudomonas sp. NPDC088444]|uniref:hypothetical protein n=1 Tax=Pseudomonas sp. NPDC088444 TaxID=3364456 RepID=UPI00384FA3C2
MTWYTESWQRMESVYSRCKAEGLDAAAISKAIDDSYPYNSRSGWAYKAWLDARRNFFPKHNIPLRRAKRPEPELFA